MSPTRKGAWRGPAGRARREARAVSRSWVGGCPPRPVQCIRQRARGARVAGGDTLAFGSAQHRDVRQFAIPESADDGGASGSLRASRLRAPTRSVTLVAMLFAPLPVDAHERVGAAVDRRGQRATGDALARALGARRRSALVARSVVARARPLGPGYAAHVRPAAGQDDPRGRADRGAGSTRPVRLTITSCARPATRR